VQACGTILVPESFKSRLPLQVVEETNGALLAATGPGGAFVRLGGRGARYRPAAKARPNSRGVGRSAHFIAVASRISRVIAAG
jgi:hypothetical protein